MPKTIDLRSNINVMFKQAPFVWCKGDEPRRFEISVIEFPYDIERYLVPVVPKDVEEAQAMLNARPELGLAYCDYCGRVSSLVLSDASQIEMDATRAYFLLRPLSREEMRHRIFGAMGGKRICDAPRYFEKIFRKLNELEIPFTTESVTATCSFGFHPNEGNVEYELQEITVEGVDIFGGDSYDLGDWINVVVCAPGLEQELQFISFDFEKMEGKMRFRVPAVCVTAPEKTD